MLGLLLLSSCGTLFVSALSARMQQPVTLPLTFAAVTATLLTLTAASLLPEGAVLPGPGVTGAMMLVFMLVFVLLLFGIWGGPVGQNFAQEVTAASVSAALLSCLLVAGLKKAIRLSSSVRTAHPTSFTAAAVVGITMQAMLLLPLLQRSVLSQG